jgi:hypothetical protein
MLDRESSDDDSAHPEADSRDSQASMECRSKLYDKPQAQFLDLYVFAIVYEAVSLRIDIMSAMRHLHENTDYWTGLASAPSVFARLPASSIFCQFLIKHTACRWNGDLREEDRKISSDLPAAFFLPIMQINSRRANSRMDNRGIEQELAFRCHFHEHASVEEKRVCWHWQHEAAGKPFIQALVGLCKETVVAKPTTGENTMKTHTNEVGDVSV